MINKKTISIFIVIVFMIIGIVAITGRNEKPLPGYDGRQDETTTAEEKTATAPVIDTFEYADSETGLNLSIPSDWQKVTMDGYPTFVHAPSATSVQVQVMDYDPYVTLANETDISARLAADDKTLLNFYWVDNKSYITMYQSNSDNITDYIEVTLFDRQHLAHLVYTVSDQYYDRMKDTITYSMDSIQWESDDPVPEGFTLYYSDAGDFEFGIPVGWDAGFVDGAFYANDTVTGASYTVTVVPSTDLYGQASEISYVNYASAGRNNFMLKSFVSDKNIINATATYNANGTQMMLRQYMIANGKHEYCVTEECPAESYDAVADLFEEATQVFRIFELPAAEEEATTVPETLSGLQETDTQETVTENPVQQGTVPETTAVSVPEPEAAGSGINP